MRCSLKFFLALTLCVAGVSRVHAGVVVATNAQSGAGPFTPSYTTPAGDLLLGRSPSAQSGDFTKEGTGGVSVLTNGTFGSITGVSNNNPSLATTGDNGAGSTVTYSLDLGASPAGYDITSIITQGGWNDGGRDQQKYNVYYSTVAAPATFIPIGLTVDFNPPPGGIPSASQVTITNSTSMLAAGVAKLRFDFAPPNGPSGVENGHVGMAELIAVGTNAAAVATNLLVNGGFESPVAGAVGNNIGTVPTGWSVDTNNNGSFNLVLDPAGAFDGNQYLDLTALGTSVSQQFTLATTSTVDFGAYFSPRDGGTGGGHASIYDATNTILLYDAPIVLAGPNYEWLLSSAATGALPAGTYTFRASLDDPANVDHAYVHSTPVPEPSTLALCMLGAVGLFMAGRRR